MMMMYVDEIFHDGGKAKGVFVLNQSLEENLCQMTIL